MTGVALVAHSTKPRGGLVHTLGVAEALHRQGYPVHVITLGDPARGLFRPTPVPHTVLSAPDQGGPLADRVFAAIDALADGLRRMADRFDILHAQDCIAARAATAVRDGGPAGTAHDGGPAGTAREPGAPVTVLRTVHHVDDFTTPALITCQRRAIHEPDRVLVVSRPWQQILRDDYGVEPEVVPNGVDRDRFPAPPAATRTELRARIGAQHRFLFLAVGGIEPRKGSAYLVEALARLVRVLDPPPMLAVVGGHSFQDYAAYRERVLASLPGLGLSLDRDVALLGTVDDAELAGWYAAADSLAFPSVNEGWGLVVLEAMSMGLPVVASDVPVFREYLTDDQDALLPAAADGAALAAAMQRLVTDAGLRDRLRAGGRAVAARHSWNASAQRHREIYAQVRGRSPNRLMDA